MKITFKDCLEKRRIFRFEPAKHLVDLELKDANNDFLSAKEELAKEGIKWATIKGYYAMYHVARALLYSLGYRERGHYCLYLAMKEFFVKEKKLAPEIAEDLYNCMILREDADYKRKFSAEGAARTIEAAERFIKTSKEILGVKHA